MNLDPLNMSILPVINPNNYYYPIEFLYVSTKYYKLPGLLFAKIQLLYTATFPGPMS